jgi:predicted TPR repeat methyltransferase
MKCRTCHNEKLEMFLDLGNQPHCDNFLTEEELKVQESYYPLQVCFCHDCTTVQINYTVPKETMFDDFAYLSGTTKTLREHFSNTTDRLVLKLNLKKEDLVVDIGSNDGTWLLNYQKYGMRILGIDPAKNIAKMANNAGVETWDNYFDVDLAFEILKKKGPAKLITAAGVFFHLEKLHSVTDGVRELLTGDGTFCIQAIYLGSIIKNTAFDQIYHEHLTYWTVRSLGTLLERHGLQIYNVDLLPIHGGSLEVLAGHKGMHPINESVQYFLTEETGNGYNRIETYYQFAYNMRNIKNQLITILRDYRSKNKKVYAYGAPAKGSTLLNSFGIDIGLIRKSVEVSPLKIGKYIPGCRIPIVDEATTEKPGAYLLLAWNFLREILQKNQSYIQSGGEFIVPFPTPVVINKSNWESFR